jgi:hypothetical protein
MNKKMPDFGRLERKPRQSHSFEREASRIEKANKNFGPLSGGGKSNVEYGHNETRAKHEDLVNRFTGNLKGGKTDEAK